MESTPTKIIRVLLGLLLLFGGLNKFLALAPNPEHNEAGGMFLGALAATGYMIPLIGLIEALCGAAFVAGRFVALSAVLLAPISINIVLFHAVLDPSGGAPGYFVGAANLYLIGVCFSKYQDMLMPR